MAEPRPLSLSRVENLSDGVFGFAMTLLVLGLGVDEAYGLLQAGDFSQGVATMLPRLLVLTFAFFGIGGLWLAHTAQFRFVERVDRNLAYLNLLCLLFVVLMPFSSAVWGRQWDRPWAIALVIGNLLLVDACLLLAWQYIGRRPALAPGVDAARRRQGTAGHTRAIAVFAFVAALAFVSPLASVVAFVALTFAFALPGVSRYLWRGLRRPRGDQ